MRTFNEKPQIVFEGGLGSQLLPLIESLNLKSQGIAFDVSVDYFYPAEISKNMVQRPWKLDRYGFPIEDVYKLGISNSTPSIFRRHKALTFNQYARQIAPELIPIAEQVLQTFLKSYKLNIGSDFSVVHLRRGDYLNVSSRVISDEEVAHALVNVEKMLDADVFIVSDSKITLKKNSVFKDLLENSQRRFHFVEGTKIDELTVHDLMRTANFLVCSNSTFSFSAALLAKKNARAIAPIDFFDPETMETVNKRFRSAGNFFILD
jgi:hypothetical protein